MPPRSDANNGLCRRVMLLLDENCSATIALIKVSQTEDTAVMSFVAEDPTPAGLKLPQNLKPLRALIEAHPSKILSHNDD